MRNSTTIANLNENYTLFNVLLTLAEQLLSSNNLTAAAAIAQIAAHHAFTSHSGLFASPRLERLLLALGCRIPASSRPRSGSVRNVLHVLTYARYVGGDTRFVRRWIEQDTNHRHSVIVTRQSDLKGPESLAEAVSNAGGTLRTLRAPVSRPLEQALELRDLAQEMDAVALHLFPDDIVPVLAFAPNDSSRPTIFVNHSDHTFWVGSSIAHLIIHLRSQSHQFLAERRGLDPAQAAIIPIPLLSHTQSLPVEQAKRALGYGPDTVLLLTIASSYKYTPFDSVSFLELVVPVLQRNPQAVLLAVGPKPTDAWRSASLQTQGRVVALGPRWDTELLYAAADVYLDSFPFSSITSLLEAGIHGTPLLAYCPPNPEPWLLGPGAPGLESIIKQAVDSESYRKLLNYLICDPGYRRHTGQRSQERIFSLHTGDNWISALNAVYQQLEQTTNRKCLVATSDTFGDGALDRAVAQVMQRISIGLAPIIDTYVSSLPYRSRFLVLLRLLQRRLNFSLSMFLPAFFESFVVGRAAWVGRAVRQILPPRKL